MSRTLRVEKTNLIALSEAQATMKQLYEDGNAVYFEVSDEKAESVAEQTGGLLDMNE